MTNNESRKDCEGHQLIMQDLKNAVFGNGRIGILARVIKLEVLIWIVIVLLLGNGGLMAYTLKILSGVTK